MRSEGSSEQNYGWMFQTGALESPTVQHLEEKLGLSEIELASLYLPVLAIEQGIDLSGGMPVATKTRVVKRTDLAARLHVDPDKPFGMQLAARGILTHPEALLLDYGLFENRSVNILIRVDKCVPGATNRIADIGITGLAQLIGLEQKNNQLFATLRTRRFTQLARLLSRDLNEFVVLLSFNNSFLYL